MTTNEEYEGLKAEMLAWQGRRIELLQTSAALVTAIVGLDLLLQPTLAVNWALVSSVLLVFLACAGCLTWYAARGTSKAAAYIRIFHEVEQNRNLRWETRLGKLKDKGVDNQDINKWLALIYLALAVISILVPALPSSFAAPEPLTIAVLLICAGAEIGSLVLMYGYSYPRATYDAYWKVIKEEESRGTSELGGG